jgi:hypothetical protein
LNRAGHIATVGTFDTRQGWVFAQINPVCVVVLLNNPANIVGKVCRELELSPPLGVPVRAVERVIRVHFDGRMRKQVAAQVGCGSQLSNPVICRPDSRSNPHSHISTSFRAAV